jgi:tetratricopeptide (TPR) repeat protein
MQLKREPDVSQTLQKILNNSRSFPNGHEIVGDFYAGNRRWDAALQEYNEGLRSNAKDKSRYQRKTVKVLIAEGKRDDAIQLLNDVLETSPDDLDSRIARAILLREANNPKSLDFAISEMNAILSKNPNDEVVHFNLGLAYLTKGDPGAARSQFLESSRGHANYLPPRLALAELAQKTGNYQETIRMADEVLSVDPSNADARLWHAAGLLGSKAYEQARRELDALLRDYPQSVNVNLHYAVLDTAVRKYRDAETRYLRFFKPGQRDLRPLEGLIQLHIEERQIDKALRLLEEELKQAPDSRAVHLLLAATAVRAGQLDLASEQYEWLRSSDPQSAHAYSSLGDVYQLKGDLNRALASYQKARELAPNDPKIIAMVAFLQTTSGQSAEAILNLRKQLAVDPENAIALNNLAFNLADTGSDLDQALMFAEKAQKNAPNNPGIADTLAWVYTKKGLNDSAIQILNGLVKKYPDEPSFRYHLGVALLQKGQTAEAKAEFVISLSKKPPKDVADKIKQIIAKIG